MRGRERGHGERKEKTTSRKKIQNHCLLIATRKLEYIRRSEVSSDTHSLTNSEPYPPPPLDTHTQLKFSEKDRKAGNRRGPEECVTQQCTQGPKINLPIGQSHKLYVDDPTALPLTTPAQRQPGLQCDQWEDKHLCEVVSGFNVRPDVGASATRGAG